MVFGRRPLAKRGQWPRYEGFFKLFPFPRILPNGNKPSAHFRHLVPAEWRSYSAVAVASSVRINVKTASVVAMLVVRQQGVGELVGGHFAIRIVV